MSLGAKRSFLAAFVLLVISFAVQFMTGGVMNLNYVLLGLALAAVFIGILFDRRLYWEFFTMRTTKHGMNMGLLIFLAAVLVVCLNYLASRHNKTWDVTHEKSNSLSEQTVNLLKGLKSDVTVKAFYRGGEADEDRVRLKNTLRVYEDLTPKLKGQFVNSYIDTEQAMRYLKDLPDGQTAPMVVFAEFGEKRIRVEAPFDEAQLTSALIKGTREGSSKIYFVKGHGEKPIDGDEDFGLSELAKSLGEASFKVETLSLVDTPEIPTDAAVVAIIGPQLPYLDAELESLRKYLRAGGRLFVALDPGQRHNLANLTKPIGVQFQNNFILSRTQIAGAGPATILGRSFDPLSDITKNFPQGSNFAVFPLASEIQPANDKSSTIEVREIVKSDPLAFTMVDPTKPPQDKPKTQAVTVGISAKGKMDAADKGSFEAVVFGDSDFLANRGLFMGVNRDLALNAIADLTNQKDLISIRPKLPPGTTVTLTAASRFTIIVGIISIPLALLITGLLVWFKRRGA